MDNPVYKLLIVEDDLGIAQAIQTQASMWNFDVRIVENFHVCQLFLSLLPQTT